MYAEYPSFHSRHEVKSRLARKSLLILLSLSMLFFASSCVSKDRNIFIPVTSVVNDACQYSQKDIIVSGAHLTYDGSEPYQTYSFYNNPMGFEQSDLVHGLDDIYTLTAINPVTATTALKGIKVISREFPHKIPLVYRNGTLTDPKKITSKDKVSIEAHVYGFNPPCYLFLNTQVQGNSGN